jgi:hypothetical protein
MYKFNVGFIAFLSATIGALSIRSATVFWEHGIHGYPAYSMLLHIPVFIYILFYLLNRNIVIPYLPFIWLSMGAIFIFFLAKTSQNFIELFLNEFSSIAIFYSIVYLAPVCYFFFTPSKQLTRR